MSSQADPLILSLSKDDRLEDAPAPDRDDWARPLIERQLAVLSDLTEAALAVSLTLQRKITAAGSDDLPGEVESLTLAFTRAARAVRLTIALQSKLVAEARDPAPGALDEQRQARRAQVNRIIRRVVGEGTRDVDICVYRWGQARERLEHDDIYGDLLSRPASEIVAAVCQDLGVAPDWPPWQPAFDDDDDEEADEDDFDEDDWAAGDDPHAASP
jgi:hypothetical protein